MWLLPVGWLSTTNIQTYIHTYIKKYNLRQHQNS